MQMRTRAALGALSGALALSAFTAPAAGAAGAVTDIRNIVVNGGKPVAIGVNGTVSVPVTMSLTAATYAASATLFHGDYPAGVDASVEPVKNCGGHSGTYTCNMTFDFTAGKTVKKNSQAGAWGAFASAVGNANAQRYFEDAFYVVRAAKLTANASPEPVKKGKAITVTGRLTRANWDTGAYAGNINQSVKLQFRKKGSSTYTTVKTVTSGTDGALKATATAATDGYWRWSFAGTITTGAATAAGDYVDVQ
ncbi:calcium-binding protein [Streptomyces sp. NPDC006446]|uniref:calcium-binding protein n=1 Tax=Streptomyces sp. NPDC006446 TaxID=3154301 RepID=UPI0033B2A33F